MNGTDLLGSPPAVRATARAVWRIRLASDLPRRLVCAAAVAGLLASARYALLPPRPARPVAARVTTPDPAAEQFATLFARRYLTWDASRPDLHQLGLRDLIGADADPDAGLRFPPSGTETVQSAEIAQMRPGDRGERVYTVAAQTDSAGLIYLSVTVARDSRGRLRLGSYPALVGAPSVAAADLTGQDRLPDVADSSLERVALRALHNYLSGSVSNLAADLGPGARVTVPAVALHLDRLTSLKWSPAGGAVLAQVDASDGRGVSYSLRYELDVASLQGRWDIQAIQTDPTA